MPDVTIDTTVTEPVSPDQTAENESLETDASEDGAVAALKAKLDAAEKAKKAAENALTLEKKAHQALKRTQMNEQELAAEKLRENEEKAKELDRMKSALSVQQVFGKAGLVEDEYKDWLDMLVTEDAERSTLLAQGMVDLMTRRVEAARKAEREKVLKEMPTPPPGDPQNATKAANIALAQKLGKAASANSGISNDVLKTYGL